MFETFDNGGSSITSNHLYINEGLDGSPYHEVSTYDENSLSITINVNDIFGSMTVASGLTYSFTYAAQNVIGFGPVSNTLQVALARPPTTPAAPTFNVALSNRNQITVQWSIGVSVDTPVTGYRLYSDLGLQGDLFMIYNGDGNINKLFYTHTGLTTGLLYQYTVDVLNFNGPSGQSG